MRRVALLVACVGATVMASCGAGERGSTELQVFAASSLEGFLSEWAPDLEEELDIRLAMSFASSAVVARQVVEGAPADVLITADRESMQVAAAAGAVGPRTVVARNRLALVVRDGNPARIDSVADLRRRDLKLVLCDPDVPCGRLASALLNRVGVTVSPDSLEENVAAAVGKVALGEADATIAYGSDVAGERRDIDEVPLPEANQRVLEAVYPAAVVRRAARRAAAQTFIDLLASPEGVEAFQRAGFLAP